MTDLKQDIADEAQHIKAEALTAWDEAVLIYRAGWPYWAPVVLLGIIIGHVL